tara:strand:+ start:231 stop:461 length:231 start_codon:yes stop_codon:yes gene_type:complete
VSRLQLERVALMIPVVKQQQNFVTALVACTTVMELNVLMGTGAPTLRNLLLAPAVCRQGNVLIPHRKNVFMLTVFG